MKKFCIHCQNEIEYRVVEETAVNVVRGKEVSYTSIKAICPVCNSELYVPEINDANLDRLEDAYKKQEDIISIKEMEDILDMYNIGKRPLSRLLGFGEITLTRFLDGKVPSKKSSDVLKEVLESTEKMREYVKRNTDETLSSACEKVLTAINEIEYIKNASKIEQVAQYFLINLEEVSNMAINKLLHFAQVASFIVYGKPLFEEESQAWVHGPVYADIYQKYKNYDKNVIASTLKDDKKLDLNDEERKLLDKVAMHFGCYTAIALRNMSHVESIWPEVRKGLRADENSQRHIKLTKLEGYAKLIKAKLEIETLDDIEKYSKHLRQCATKDTKI